MSAVTLPLPSRMDRWRRKLSTLYSAIDEDSEEQGTSDGSGGPGAASSPVNKRKVFSGRIWLPTPLRKLSQGKVEKSGAPDRPAFKKTPLDKKAPVEMGNKPGGVEEEASARLDNGEEGEEEVELPPPMKPIQEPLIVPSEDTPGDGASNLSLQPLEGAAEIEQIVKERMEQHSEKQERSSGGGEMEALVKRDQIVQEMVETERLYVRDLGLVVHGYLGLMRDPACEIPMPEDLVGGKDRIVFGNIEAIYEWHRDSFLTQLEDCLPQPEKLGPLFKNSEKRLQMYVVYCKNKPLSEYIVSEHIDTYFEQLRLKLGHRLTLCDLLIKPVQRIMKYQLMLQGISKYTDRTGQQTAIEQLRGALQIMHEIPKAANDMMSLSRLKNYQGNITAQGKLLMHGTLSCTELSNAQSGTSKPKDLQVFLFEQSIIFSEATGKSRKYTEPNYNYKAHFQVNKMKMNPRTAEDIENCRLTVVSTDPKKRLQMGGFVCVAPSRELFAEWCSKLDELDKSQSALIKALQSPIAYQKELTKEICSPYDNWSPSQRITLSPPEPAESADLEPCLITTQDCNLRMSSPSKNRLTLLDNMKNVLGRTRSKEAADEAPAGLEAQPQESLSAGSLARVVVDFPALRPDELHVRTGDVVGIIRVGSRGCLVRLCYEDAVFTGPEGWVPASILSPQARGTVKRKPWSFRLRKTSAAMREAADTAGCLEPPVLMTALRDTVVAVGDRAQLTCRIRPASGDVSVTWRCGAADYSVIVRPGGRFAVYSSTEGDCSLSIHGCRATDTGQYTCTITNGAGSVASSARLSVRANAAEGEDDDGGSADWQAEQFRRRYEQLSELGHGRMSVVRAARDRGTGHVVAVKQIQRSRQSAAVTRAEYNLLATLRHAHLPRALALFTNAPDASTDSIVMELAKEPLLECVCRHSEYSEKTVRRAMRELISAVACLHNHNALHLDIRPENVLVDGSGSVKLVDLGEGVRRLALSGAVLPPVSLEFAAPEIVLGKSAAAPADLWSLGVFLYVFLSGVSPFLDESLEETTGHILQGDFFFSADHFSGVTAEAKELVTSLLQTPPHCRGTAACTLLHPWFQMDKSQSWSTEKLRQFMERRRSSSNILSSLKN